MANLSSLIHELRERIASSSASSSSGEDPLETRFRTVLPNLLHAYVLPSSTSNEREVTAVLKLLAHTARNFPGVFFSGRAAAVLPVVGRVLTFLADPTFRSRHGIIFDTVASLLSLLRSGDREAYRQFFLDTMDAIQDIFYVASLPTNSTVLLKCFVKSFAGITSSPVIFSELPSCCRPKDGPGVLVHLDEKSRWQHFAVWMIRLISRCLTEGTIYVEGLVTVPFVSNVCSFLCYGCEDLHVACFDFVRTVKTVIDADILPEENMIRSILCILEQDEEAFILVRNTAYDSSLGACLHALYSACHGDVVQSTAVAMVHVFPKALQGTDSIELQVAMCSAYIQVAKMCPPSVWKPGLLVNVLSSQRPCLPLIDCISVAICILSSAKTVVFDGNMTVTTVDAYEISRIGKKRFGEHVNNMNSKRQKTCQGRVPAYVLRSVESAYASPSELDRDYADSFQYSLSSLVGCLRPDSEALFLGPENAIEVLSMLCIAFYVRPHWGLSIGVFQQVFSWISWICKKAKDGIPCTYDIMLFLEAIHSILHLQGAGMLVFSDDDSLSDTSRSDADCLGQDTLVELVRLVWDNHLGVVQSCPVFKAKCLSIQILSKLGNKLIRNILDVLDLAIHDEAEEVRQEAIMSLPMIVLFSGHVMLTEAFKRLELLVVDENDQIGKAVISSLGYLSCLYGSSSALNTADGMCCKLFLGSHFDKQINTLDLLSNRFSCPLCDQEVWRNQEQNCRAICMPKLQNIKLEVELGISNLQQLFFQFLSKESSDEVQVTFALVIPRILRHASRDALLDAKIQWVNCIDCLLLHKAKVVREAFCSTISCFVENHILESLFLDETNEKTKEQKFLDKLKHGLAGAEDPQMFETLLESIVEVMNATVVQEKLFIYSLILLVDQLDNPHSVVRIYASRLIHRSCSFHMKGGFEAVISKFSYIRDELYEYLCTRLVSRPAMVREFAEAVVGIKIDELIRRMVPYVIPKLIVTPKDDQAAVTLHELANYSNIDVVPLIVNWLPKLLYQHS